MIYYFLELQDPWLLIHARRWQASNLSSHLLMQVAPARYELQRARTIEFLIPPIEDPGYYFQLQ